MTKMPVGRGLLFAVVLFAAVQPGGCAATRTYAREGTATTTDADSLRALAHHVVSRLTFGATPELVDEVLRTGIDRWIEGQLECSAVEPVPGVTSLFANWSLPADSAADAMSVLHVVPGAGGSAVFGDYFVLGEPGQMADSGRASILHANRQFLAGKIAYHERSPMQLCEVMTDFWANHFSVYRERVPRGALVHFERSTIRPNAMGSLRTLLGAVAHSPAMLEYLDNISSTAEPDRIPLFPLSPGRTRAGYGMNENFARELLELHTLGSGSTFTQLDVREVARAFTGWGHTGGMVLGSPMIGMRQASGKSRFNRYARVAPAFDFDSLSHDAETKRPFGLSLAAHRGVEDGEDVLDYLARSPNTAWRIARKLVVRFVNDEPPEPLVQRAADTFLRTGGDIREVMRTILMSEEFRSPAHYRAKIKSPLEFLLSVRRTLNAPVDTGGYVVDQLTELGQTPFGHVAPDGWPEVSSRWMSAAQLDARFRLIEAIARGSAPSIPLSGWSAWERLSQASHEAQVGGVVAGLLNGTAAASTVAVIRSAPRDSEGAIRLAEMIRLALASPEFQRR